MAKARKVRESAPVKRVSRKSTANAWNDEVTKKECIHTVLELHRGQSTTMIQIVDEAGFLYNFIKGATLAGGAQILEMRLPEGVPQSEKSWVDSVPDLSQVHTQSNHRSKFEETHTL